MKNSGHAWFCGRGREARKKGAAKQACPPYISPAITKAWIKGWGFEDARIEKQNVSDPNPIPAGYWKIDAYTNGYEIIVIGEPLQEQDLPDDDPLVHNCDQMGCGSVTPHVIARIEVTKRPPPEMWPKYNNADLHQKIKDSVLTEAREEGRKARRDRLALTDCRYDSAELRTSWINGWNDIDMIQGGRR